MAVQSLTEEQWQLHLRQLRSRGEELRSNLASRVKYETLYDAIGACHEVYDLLSAIKAVLVSHVREDDKAFLVTAIDLGFEQVSRAMSHGFEVYGQELDPMKYRLNVAVAIARYAAGRLPHKLEGAP